MRAAKRKSGKIHTKALQSAVAPIDAITSIFQQAQSIPSIPGDRAESLQHRDSKMHSSVAGGNASVTELPVIVAAAPEPSKMGLHEALRRLNDGTLPR